MGPPGVRRGPANVFTPGARRNRARRGPGSSGRQPCTRDYITRRGPGSSGHPVGARWLNPPDARRDPGGSGPRLVPAGYIPRVPGGYPEVRVPDGGHPGLYPLENPG